MSRSQLLQLVKYWHQHEQNQIVWSLFIICCRHQDCFWQSTVCNWGGATAFQALSYHLVSTACEGLYCRWLHYTGKTPVKWGCIWTENGGISWTNQKHCEWQKFAPELDLNVSDSTHNATFLAENIFVCLSMHLHVWVFACCQLYSVVDDDVNVVFWVHRKLNTKLKLQCLIKCARWSQERCADTTATPSFICKPPNAGLKYRK